MTVKEDLIASKALIDTPDKWINGHAHKWAGGQESCHCAWGAIVKTCRKKSLTEQRAVIRSLGFYVDDGLIKFNDLSSTTHSDIMALFDRAIGTQP